MDFKQINKKNWLFYLVKTENPDIFPRYLLVLVIGIAPPGPGQVPQIGLGT